MTIEGKYVFLQKQSPLINQPLITMDICDKLYGLIGYPLGHSFSRGFFNQKFETENKREIC